MVAFIYLKSTCLTVTVETWQLVHGNTVTCPSQSSLTTSTFCVADMLLADWRPGAYMFVAGGPAAGRSVCYLLLAVRRQEAYDLCCLRPGAGVLAFMQSGCLLHEAGVQQQQQQQHTNHLPRSCRDQVSHSVLRQNPQTKNLKMF